MTFKILCLVLFKFGAFLWLFLNHLIIYRYPQEQWRVSYMTEIREFSFRKKVYNKSDVPFMAHAFLLLPGTDSAPLQKNPKSLWIKNNPHICSAKTIQFVGQERRARLMLMIV